MDDDEDEAVGGCRYINGVKVNHTCMYRNDELDDDDLDEWD